MRSTALKAAFIGVLAAGMVLPAVARERAERRFEGIQLKPRSVRADEAEVLRAPAETWRAYQTLRSLYVVVAESREDWDRGVGPGIAKALGPGGSEDAFDRFVNRLPETLQVAGPDLDGALIRIDLPGDRGKAWAAIHLPGLIKSGRESNILNSRAPNVGFFLSGADIRRSDGDDVRGFYMPSRPKDLARGAVPKVEVRELPRKGKGDLAVLRGRGATGDDGDDVRAALQRFVRRDELAVNDMRAFPRKGVLAEALKTIRSEVDLPAVEDGWYRTLSSDPARWTWERSSVRQPTKYLAQVLPVTVEDDGRLRQVVVGVVAFYSRVFLSPEQAAAHSGDGKAFFEAVHRGEVPFWRLDDDVLFYRAHIDRWLDGDGKSGGSKGRKFKSGLRQAEALAERARNRDVDRAILRPLPFRMDAIPADELEEMVDTHRRARSRMFDGDLLDWLSHHGDLRKGDPRPVWVTPSETRVAELRAKFSVPSSVLAATSVKDRGSSSTLDRFRDRLEVDDEPEDEPELSADEPEDEDEDEDEPEPADDFDLDALGEEPSYESWSGDGPATLQSLEIFDFYTPGGCRSGEVVPAVVEFAYEGPPDGELGTLKVEWDFFLGDANVARDSMGALREGGSHELEFELTCPATTGSGRLELLIADAERGLQAEASATLTVRAANRRQFTKLVKPSPKKCLSSGPALDDGEDYGMTTQKGLDADQIRSAIRSFQEQTLRCHSGAGFTGTVHLEFSVGCDGLPIAVKVLEDDTSDSTGGFADCVADTMSYAPFPAHELDEAVFEMPLRFE